MAEVTNISPDNKGTDRILRFLKMLSAVPILILFLLFSLPSMIYTVQTHEVAVIQRFGKYNRTEQPGLHFKMPWDLESVYRVPVLTNLKMEFGFRTTQAGVRSQYDTGSRYDAVSMMLTGDLNLVDVSWIIQYEIKDAKEYLYNVRSVDVNLFDLSVSVMREVVGDHTVNETISSSRDEIATQAMQNMQKILDEYHMGIRLVALKLQDAIVPDKVKSSFDEVNAAVQDAKQIANLAKKNREKLLKEATGKAEQEIKNAEAYKVETINRAMGDTQRFLALYQEYNKAPEITKQRLYFDKLKTVMGKANKVILIDPAVKTVLPHLSLGGVQ